MLNGKHVLILVIIIIICSFNPSKGEEFIQYYHDQPVTREVVDSLISIRIEDYGLGEAEMYAQAREFLDDDFEIQLLSGEGFLFRVADGYDYHNVAGILRNEDTVLMVNPVLESLEEGVMYLDNRITPVCI